MYWHTVQEDQTSFQWTFRLPGLCVEPESVWSGEPAFLGAHVFHFISNDPEIRKYVMNMYNSDCVLYDKSMMNIEWCVELRGVDGHGRQGLAQFTEMSCHVLNIPLIPSTQLWIYAHTDR